MKYGLIVLLALIGVMAFCYGHDASLTEDGFAIQGWVGACIPLGFVGAAAALGFAVGQQ